MRTTLQTAFLLAVTSLPAAAAAQSFRLDFQDGVGSWSTVLDGVMGGRSTGRVTQPEAGVLRFTGRLSLENNGGFSQMRTAVARGALAGAEGIELDVRGDGRSYKFDIRQSTVRMMAGAYQQEFATKDGEWTRVRLPLTGFTLYSFGRKVRRAPPLDASKIESLGITLADKKAGSFALEVRSIAAYGADASPGDGGDAAGSGGDDLASVARSAGLDTLLRLVEAAGLPLPQTPVTILAPTDEAFAAIPRESLRNLLRPESRETLRLILSHHILPAPQAAGDLLQRRTLTSLAGQPLAVDDVVRTVGGAGLVATDVRFDGGLVHVVDTVLMPETRSIAEVAAATPELATLVTAVTTAGLAEQLGPDNGPWTVFAPVDSAFARLPNGTLATLLEQGNRRQLTEILGLHVVPGRIAARDLLAKKQLTTLMGAPIELRLVDRKLQVGDATIVTTDVQAANGVVHLIDRVLTEPAGGGERGKDVRQLQPREPRAVDVSTEAMRVYEAAIRRGAGLWNDGNRDGCAAVYEVAILSMIALGRDRLPAAVVEVLVEASQRGGRQDAVQAAWTYRNALDEVYRRLRSGAEPQRRDQR
ncbi:MAG: CIA30 family protein [Planctomycetota bacterium]